jgi:hypothetical protein
MIANVFLLIKQYNKINNIYANTLNKMNGLPPSLPSLSPCVPDAPAAKKPGTWRAGLANNLRGHHFNCFSLHHRAADCRSPPTVSIAGPQDTGSRLPCSPKFASSSTSALATGRCFAFA